MGIDYIAYGRVITCSFIMLSVSQGSTGAQALAGTKACTGAKASAPSSSVTGPLVN